MYTREAPFHVSRYATELTDIRPSVLIGPKIPVLRVAAGEKKLRTGERGQKKTYVLFLDICRIILHKNS